MSDETASKIADVEVQEILEALDDFDAGKDPVEEVEPSDHSKQVLRAAAVVPIHDAPSRRGPKAKRGPGRPPKVAPKPTPEDVKYHQEVIARQTQFVDGDKVVQATRDKASSLETLQLIKERLAIAGANLDFHRIELQKRGVHQKDIAQVISRQIGAMKEIANIELEISKFQASIFNLRDERLQRVFAMLIETMRDILAEALSVEQFDLVWNHLETALEGWEERAEDLVR